MIQIAYEKKIEINYIIIMVLGLFQKELAITAIIL